MEKEERKVLPNKRVKVEKQAFDKILGKLIQTAPIPRKPRPRRTKTK